MTYLQELDGLCSRVAVIQQQMMYGEIGPSEPNREFRVLGPGHVAELLAEIVAPVGMDAMLGRNVELGRVIALSNALKGFTVSFNIDELIPVVDDIDAFIEKNQKGESE